MKAIRILSIILLTIMVMGCSKKDNTEYVQSFKEAVFGYMYSAQSMAVFIAENINTYEKGLHYFDTENGYLTYSRGDYCEDVHEVVAIIRDQYKKQKSIDVIRSYKSEAKMYLPQGKDDLEQLYRLAEEMDRLATTSELTHTYGHKYKLLIDSFIDKFSASDLKYPNTAVNFEKVKGDITRLQEVLMGS